MLRSVGAVIAVVMALAAGSARASLMASPGAGESNGATGADPNAAKIAELIQSASERNGERSPSSIEWVYGKRSAIAKLLDFGIPADEGATDQVLVIARGNFKVGNAKIPNGAEAPTGTVIELVLDPTTWDSTDFGVVNVVPNLGSIGVPRTK